MSAIAKVASLWDIELAPEGREEDDEPFGLAARCHISIDGKPGVPISDEERDLLRCALLYSLVHFYGFANFADENGKQRRPAHYELNALLHGLAHIVERGESSPRDTKNVAAWRRTQPRTTIRRRVPLRISRYRR